MFICIDANNEKLLLIFKAKYKLINNNLFVLLLFINIQIKVSFFFYIYFLELNSAILFIDFSRSIITCIRHHTVSSGIK